MNPQNQQQPQGYGGQQYQGYNNQYYQNYYAQQQQPVDTHADTPESKRHANKKFIIGIAAVALVIVVFVGAFLFLQKQGEADVGPVVPSGEETLDLTGQLTQVEIEEVKLCSYIDENYNCNEKPGGEFDKGEDVYLYVKVVGFEQIETKEGYLFGLEESIETVDPSGAIIDPLTGIAMDVSDFADQRKDSLLFRNKIPNLYLFNPGQHTVTLSLRDKVTGIVAKKTLNFVVRGL